jgi:hypothetical protein
MVETPTIAPEDELLTSLDASRELGCARSTLYSWYWRGFLPGRETPIGLLIRRADLDAFKARRHETRKRGEA